MMKHMTIVCIVSLALLAGCDRSQSTPANSPPSSDESSTSSESSGASSDKSKDKQDEAPEPNAPSESGEKADLPDDLEKGETGHYGADFRTDEEPITLADALEQHETNEDGETSGPYKVRARVDKVCKKKGCWFKLSGDSVESPIRVRMKDYGFFVPRNSDGGEAIVEGTLQTRELSKKELRHYAKDQGKDPSEIDVSERKRREFTATAVQIAMGS